MALTPYMPSFLHPEWTFTSGFEWAITLWGLGWLSMGQMILSRSTEGSMPGGTSLDSENRSQAGQLLPRSPFRECRVTANGHRLAFWGDEMF